MKHDLWNRETRVKYNFSIYQDTLRIRIKYKIRLLII